MHGRSLRILKPCSSYTLAAGWSLHVGSLRIWLSKHQWISLSTLASIPNQILLLCSSLQDQLDSLAEVVLQTRRGLDLLTAEKRRLCLFLNEECCFYVNQSGIVRNMAQQLREQIIKRKEKLANSWGNWNSIWSWASWLLPLTGPVFMLFAAFLFGLIFSVLLPSL